MVKSIRKLSWIVLCAFAAVVHAGGLRPIAPADVVQVRRATDPRISPDGLSVAFVVTAPGSGTSAGRYDSDIWLVPADGSEPPRPFAFGAARETMPRWSPDGKSIAFLSDRKESGKNQVYVARVSGGEPLAVTTAADGVDAFAWIPNGNRIAFTTRQSAAVKEGADQGKHDEIVAGRSEPCARLYELDPATGHAVSVSMENENVNEFAYSPDGSSIAMSVSPSPGMDDVFYRSSLVVMRPADGSRRVLKDVTFGMIRWSVDGTLIAHLAPVGKGIHWAPEVVRVSDGSAAQGHTRDHNIIWQLEWLPGGKLLASGQEGVQGVIATVDAGTFEKHTVREVGRVYDQSGDPGFTLGGSRIAYVDAAGDAAQDVWTMNLDGSAAKRITDLNPQLKSLAFGRTEALKWKAPDGTQIEGVLVRPAGEVTGKRYPLIVQIHGGPDWCWWNGWLNSWHEWAQMLSSHGYAVLLPNPRGSVCYGQEFAEGNIGDWGGADFRDILAGVDALVQQGLADPDRLGIGGWSYGGYMTAWAVTQSPRFKAAVVGAGLTDLVSFYGLHDIPTFTRKYFKVSPFENAALYDQRSPIRFASRVTTPTLILSGANDTRVPPSQGREFFAALQERKVPSQMVLYPREPHMPEELAHQQDVLQRVLDWFDSYLHAR